ncbi:MAG: molybdopterin-dependent oxidoreductase [Cyclobacteriaceae bacterium]|nr:molybdopterin-dependent oxidoreductase [Cyclobacteriaceae bacterium]
MTAYTSNRRDFLKKLAVTTGGGLLLGFNMLDANAGTMSVLGETTLDAAGSELRFNAYLAISPDNVITIFSPNPELGQNIKTSFPMIVAEELDADWTAVKVLQAPLDKRFDRQLTGGSGAIPHSWERLRKAGAAARRMLMEAAAKRWQCDVSTLRTEKGKVISTTGQSLNYGDLATDASTLTAPTDVKLKDIRDFKLIGTAVANVEADNIYSGKPLFGIDFYREGMVYAVIQRAPAFGTRIKSVDDTAARAVSGVLDVVTFKTNVAIVGTSTWQVMKARKLLKVEYEIDGSNLLENSSDHDRRFKEMLDSPEAVVRRKDGDVTTAFSQAAKVITREYQCPFLSHSPMEPMNFFAHVRPDGVELIGPTQTPDLARNEVAKLLNVSADSITVDITRLGGGFGRRLKADYVLEAAELSSLIRKPVKVIWSREDDMTGGSYRPAVRYRFSAALDGAGNLIGYKLRGVGINTANSTREDNFPSGAVDHLLIDSVEYKSPITVGAWRAPITNFLAFAEQSFLDEVATASGKDPIRFRLELLEKAKKSPVGAIKYDIDRMMGVIKLAQEKSGWGRKDVSQGFSVYFSHRSYVAQVADVAMEQNRPVIRKIHAAIDCGVVVNVAGANQQVRGGVVDGLGHALFGNLTFKDGAAEQKNFNNYRLIRFREVPEVDVHFVNNGIDPTGLGEPALPPTGGAVANAIFKATGQRLYNQPFNVQEPMKSVRLGEKI